MPSIAAILVFLIVLALIPSQALAKRVALVIGNSEYRHTSPLKNPTNDAADVSAALKKHGFQVVEGFDLDKAAFDRKVRDFAVALQGADAGVLFYAGHGLQVDGQNYLVPIDAQLTAPSALDFETVRLDLVHRVMERETNTNVLFLDACRDNPLGRNLSRSMGTRSAAVGKGLAPVESGVGTLISFSTQPGNVALDGAGRNSPYSGALARHIATATDDLGAILVAVRNDVMKETQRKQVPWEHSALTGRFFFMPPRPQQQAFVKPAVTAERLPTPLFASADRSRLASLATKKKLPLPPIDFYAPPTHVGDELRRLIGVWVSDAGFEKSGRQYMIVVVDIVSHNTVLGHTAIAPPTAASSRSNPAGHWPFIATASGNKLVIKRSASELVATLDAKNRLLAVETWKNGFSAKVLLEPVWTLVKAERAAKR